MRNSLRRYAYMDRAVLGVLMPQVRRDLSLTNTDYALASLLLAAAGRIEPIGRLFRDSRHRDQGQSAG